MDQPQATLDVGLFGIARGDQHTQFGFALPVIGVLRAGKGRDHNCGNGYSLS